MILTPGMLVRVKVHTATDTLKRPALICETRIDGTFGMMTFSRAAQFTDGNPRTPIVDWRANGLHAPCFFFSKRLVIAPASEVIGVIGVATDTLIEAVVDYLAWRTTQAEELRTARAMANKILTAGIAS
jgi:hypothetical protein